MLEFIMFAVVLGVTLIVTNIVAYFIVMKIALEYCTNVKWMKKIAKKYMGMLKELTEEFEDDEEFNKLF